MKLTVLDPGHFHAALLQKAMVPGVDATVHVFAEEGPELADYLQKIETFNARPVAPTAWRMKVHAGADFLERFSAEHSGDVVVIAGNNRQKAEYIACAVAAGMNVLADKPMAIDTAGVETLQRSFADAAARGVLLCDIMTERHEITTMLQKAFSRIPAVFGELLPGSVRAPAVVKESVHHFSKQVSGAPVKRPAWFFDVAQQGDGLVDITTHLVDLVQWECFPGAILDFAKDIRILGAKRWPTAISPAQFAQVTQLARHPGFLSKDVQADGSLHVYANGEIDYRIRGVHAKVSVRWDFEAPAGTGDTHFSVMRGSKANLLIRQGAAEAHQPTLYIEPAAGADTKEFPRALEAALVSVRATYPGIEVNRSGDSWKVVVPSTYHVGHEAHFAQVAAGFLDCVAKGALPDWEVPGMIAKYLTTTGALEIALGKRAPAHP
ncbi:MAG: putative oxidoreductase C-terminal domain-containing protein [Casimicrobiaceae bacterium]